MASCQEACRWPPSEAADHLRHPNTRSERHGQPDARTSAGSVGSVNPASQGRASAVSMGLLPDEYKDLIRASAGPAPGADDVGGSGEAVQADGEVA